MVCFRPNGTLIWGLLQTVRPFISNFVRNADRNISEDYSVGAYADSAYEYLLKQWLLTGKTEPKSRDLCKFLDTSLVRNVSYFLFFRS